MPYFEVDQTLHGGNSSSNSVVSSGSNNSSMVSAEAGMSYTADDWQAQLEEVLALQSIYADHFRCGA
jgi:hypothetical protein